MDIVLGVSMAPSAVQMVLVEGENADGVTVDHDDFSVAPGPGTAAQKVLSAIMGTRESAREGGYQLASTGVTFTNQSEAAALRATLVDHKIENVMLISAFLAAAALAQAVGSRIKQARTGLLFIEPEAATLAVVNANDGSIDEIHRQPLLGDDDQAVAALTSLVAGVDRLESRPDGLFVVGSGVNVGMIKPELERVSPIPVSVPEDPEMALARGAALASAHAPLFSSSTRALAWAQDPGTGVVDPALVSRGLAYVPPAYVPPPAPVDYNATSDHHALAYSAVPDYGDSGYLPALDDAVDNPELTDSRLLDFTSAIDQQQERKPLLVTAGVGALFVVGVVALAGSLAINMRAGHQQHPDVKANLVTHQAPPEKAVVPPPPAPAPKPAPAPAPAAVPEAPAPVPVREAPAPIPQAPAPAPPPPAAPPPPPPILQIPGLPGGPPLPPPGRGGWGHDDDGWGHGGGHGRGHDNGPQIPIPLPIPGLHLGVGF